MYIYTCIYIHMYMMTYSMEKEQHAHTDRVMFYPWGLAGKTEIISSGWHMKTLGTIVKELGHENVRIS